MHKLRTLKEYHRPGGWRYVKREMDSLDAFRARMELYKPKPKANEVVQLKRAAK